MSNYVVMSHEFTMSVTPAGDYRPDNYVLNNIFGLHMKPMLLALFFSLIILIFCAMGRTKQPYIAQC